MNKLLLGFIVLLTVISIPHVSVSQDNANEIIVLKSSNLLVLNDEVNGDSVSAVISKARDLDAKLSKKEFFSNKEHLFLFLNSPGGSIQSGLEMNEALKGIGRPIDTITLFAASMAFQIAQNLDDRLILKNGVLMSHRAAGEFQGSFGGTRPSQLDSRYQLWLDRMTELDQQTVLRTHGKQTYDSYIKQYANEMWLTGAKAVDQGYADKVVTVKCDSSLNGVDTKHLQF